MSMTPEQVWEQERVYRYRLELIRDGWILGASHDVIKALENAVSFRDLENVSSATRNEGNVEFAEVIDEMVSMAKKIQFLRFSATPLEMELES